MGIIKVTKDGKIADKKKADETVVPLSPVDPEPAGRTLHISYVPSTRSKRLVNVFLLIMALLVLSAGIIGGVYIYKYMQHKHKMSKISVQYQDEESGHLESGNWCGTVTDVDYFAKEDLERIEVPKFDQYRRSVILHDFYRNYTSIVDIDDGECFIMDLDRKTMSPPKSFSELVRRYSSGYYMPKVDVVRKQFRVVTPALDDLSFAGPSIAAECSGYKSYKLEKKENKDWIEFHFQTMKTYVYSDLRHLIKDNVYR